MLFSTCYANPVAYFPAYHNYCKSVNNVAYGQNVLEYMYIEETFS